MRVVVLVLAALVAAAGAQYTPRDSKRVSSQADPDFSLGSRYSRDPFSNFGGGGVNMPLLPIVIPPTPFEETYESMAPGTSTPSFIKFSGSVGTPPSTPLSVATPQTVKKTFISVSRPGKKGTVVQEVKNYAGKVGNVLLRVRYESGETESLLVVSDRGVYEGQERRNAAHVESRTATTRRSTTPEPLNLSPRRDMLLQTMARDAEAPGASARGPLPLVGEIGGACVGTTHNTCLPAALCHKQGGTIVPAGSCTSSVTQCCSLSRVDMFKTAADGEFVKGMLFWRQPKAWRDDSNAQRRVDNESARLFRGSLLVHPNPVSSGARAVTMAVGSTWEDCEAECDKSATCGAWNYVPVDAKVRFDADGVSLPAVMSRTSAVTPAGPRRTEFVVPLRYPAPAPVCHLLKELGVSSDPLSTSDQYTAMITDYCFAGVRDWRIHDQYGVVREVFFAMRELLQFYRAELVSVLASAAEDVSLGVLTRLNSTGAGIVSGTEARLRGAVGAIVHRTTEIATALEALEAATAAGRHAKESQLTTLRAMLAAIVQNADKAGEWLQFLVTRAGSVDWNAGEAAELFAKAISTEITRALAGIAASTGARIGSASAAEAARNLALELIKNLGHGGGARGSDDAAGGAVLDALGKSKRAAEIVWAARTAAMSVLANAGVTGDAVGRQLAEMVKGIASVHINDAVEEVSARSAWVARTLRILSASAPGAEIGLDALREGVSREQIVALWKKVAPMLREILEGKYGAANVEAVSMAVRRISQLADTVRDADGDIAQIAREVSQQVKDALGNVDVTKLLEAARGSIAGLDNVPIDEILWYADRVEKLHAAYDAAKAGGATAPQIADVWAAARPLIDKLADRDGDGRVGGVRIDDVKWAVDSVAALRDLERSGTATTESRVAAIGELLSATEGPIARALEQHGLQATDAKFVLDRVMQLRAGDYEGTATELIGRTRPAVEAFLSQNTGGAVTADDLLWAIDTIKLTREGDRAGARKALLSKAEDKFAPILGKHGLVWADLASIVDTLRAPGGTSLKSLTGLLAEGGDNTAIAKLHGLADEALEGTGANADDLVAVLKAISDIRDTGSYSGPLNTLLDRAEPRLDAILRANGIPITIEDARWAVDTIRATKSGETSRREALDSALTRFTPELDRLLAARGSKFTAHQLQWSVGAALDIAEGKIRSAGDLSALIRAADGELGGLVEGKLPGGVTLDDVAWAVDTYASIKSDRSNISPALDQGIDRFSSQLDTALQGTGFNAQSIRWGVAAIRDAKRGDYGAAADNLLQASETKIRAMLASSNSGVKFEDLQWGLETVRAMPEIARKISANPEETAIELLTGLPDSLKTLLSENGAPVEDIVWGVQVFKKAHDKQYGSAVDDVLVRFGPKFESQLAKHGLTIDDVRFASSTAFALAAKETTAQDALVATIERFGPRVGKSVLGSDAAWGVRTIEMLAKGDTSAALTEAIDGLVERGVGKFTDIVSARIEKRMESFAEEQLADAPWPAVLASLKDEKFRTTLVTSIKRGVSYARGQRDEANLRGDLDELVFGVAGLVDNYFGFNTLGGEAYEELMKKRHERVLPPVESQAAALMFESTREFLTSKLDLMVKELEDKPGWQFHAEVAFDKKKIRAIVGTRFGANQEGEILFDFGITDPFGSSPSITARAKINYEAGGWNLGGEVLAESVGRFDPAAASGKTGIESTRVAVQGFATFKSENGRTLAGLFFDINVPINSRTPGGSNPVVRDPSSVSLMHDKVFQVRGYAFHVSKDENFALSIEAGAKYVPSERFLSEVRFGMHYRITDTVTVSALGAAGYSRGGTGLTTPLNNDGMGIADGFRNNDFTMPSNYDGLHGYGGAQLNWQVRDNIDVGINAGVRFNGGRPDPTVGVSIKFRF